MLYGVVILVIAFVAWRMLRGSGGEEEEIEVVIPADVENKFFYRLRSEAAGATSPTKSEAKDMFRSYWSPNPEEKQALLNQGIDQLEWGDLLRLHHLLCMEAIASDAGQRQLESETFDDLDFPPGESLEQIKQVVARLTSPASPYQPRKASIIQEDGGVPVMGLLQDQSITHYGCFEVLLADADGNLDRIDFIPFNEIFRLELFGEGFDLCYATIQIEFDGGKLEALVPRMYLLSSQFPPMYSPERNTNRYVCSFEVDGQRYGIGSGKHTYSMRDDGGMRLVGIGSIHELEMALSVHDPDFVERARKRGMPEEVIQQILANSPPAAS